MSTRWYPIYQRGNPQLRVFLPNFWMKLVRPHEKQLPNVVHFQCSMEMTKFDVKNYLEKIYNVPVVDVRTKIALGKFRKDVGRGYVVKDDDIKYAYVVLPKTMKFEFPDIFEKKKGDLDDDMKSLDEAKKSFKTYLRRNKDRSDVPSWFSI
ncbi:probable 39S ribosomal protein L23, mitochondrial [Aricia agestis]|uniref:probable 39S ribosomal protein L23, mitochondrial n=1 Tax=Aricia agestis TaxID=91739 RepID=UPI001C20BCBE|nr:probable 39S ribosomal protein L23, mitochondrial [Aricia agestis]